MRTGIAALATLLLIGCVTGPRPYDGVLGYQLTPHPNGYQISYIDEARVKQQKTLAKITRACAAKLHTEVSALSVKIESESTFEQAVNISIPVPVAAVGVAAPNMASRAGHSGGAMNINSQIMTHKETAQRHMKLRKTVAICSR